MKTRNFELSGLIFEDDCRTFGNLRLGDCFIWTDPIQTKSISPDISVEIVYVKSTPNCAFCLTGEGLTEFQDYEHVNLVRFNK